MRAGPGGAAPLQQIVRDVLPPDFAWYQWDNFPCYRSRF